MPEEFDPYRKWLGIPPKDQPPHYYRLLGISLFEDDPDVIENAANRQMSHVRTFQASKHAAFSQRILNELAAAKLCLLSPEKKPAYDAELKGTLQIPRAAAATAKPRPPAVPPPRPAEHVPGAPSDLAVIPGAAVPRMAIEPVRTASRVRRARQKSRRRSSPLPLILGVLAIGALLVAIVFMVTRGDSNRNKKAEESDSPPPKNRSVSKPQVRLTPALQDYGRG